MNNTNNSASEEKLLLIQIYVALIIGSYIFTASKLENWQSHAAQLLITAAFMAVFFLLIPYVFVKKGNKKGAMIATAVIVALQVFSVFGQ